MENPTAYLHDAMPLARTMGMRAATLTPESVVVELDWAPEWCTTGGVLHGGALMSLADSAGAACAFMNLPEGSNGTSTIESKTNFMGAVQQGTVTATSTPLHVGRSTIVVETSLEHADRLVGKVTQTQAVLWPRSER